MKGGHSYYTLTFVLHTITHQGLSKSLMVEGVTRRAAAMAQQRLEAVAALHFEAAPRPGLAEGRPEPRLARSKIKGTQDGNYQAFSFQDEGNFQERKISSSRCPQKVH